MELSEYELNLLENRDAFYWKEQADLWRRRYHKLSVQLIEDSNLVEYPWEKVDPAESPQKAVRF